MMGLSSSIISINLAGTILGTFLVTPLVALLAFIILYLITHPNLTKTPLLPPSKPLSQTQRNTLLNRHENGGTGVWSRKWRRNLAFALALKNGVTRRSGTFGDPEDDDEEDDEEDADDEEGAEEKRKSKKVNWNLVVKPIPEGLRGVLKREGSFEVSRKGIDAGTDTSSGLGQVKVLNEKVTSPPSNDSPLPTTPSTTSSLQELSPSPASSLDSPSPPPIPISPQSPSQSPSLLFASSNPPPPPLRKSVQIVEPNLFELESLRDLWDDPSLQGSTGAGGIAGYRRTRDFYARGQGGRGVVKGSATSASTVEKNKTGTSKGNDVGVNGENRKKAESSNGVRKKKEEVGNRDDDSDHETEEEEEDSSPIRSIPRRTLTPSSSQSRTNSLSPSPSSSAAAASLSNPSSRRPLIRRALSPNLPGSSATVGAGRTGSGSRSRRLPSPNPTSFSSSPSIITASPSSVASSSTLASSSTNSQERMQPRWVKTKPSSTTASSSSSSAGNRRLSPNVVVSSKLSGSSRQQRRSRSRSTSSNERDEVMGKTRSKGVDQEEEEVEEEEEEERIARERDLENGGMSATVSDDEDYEDLPPTPPSKTVKLPPSPHVSTSDSSTTTSTMSPCLELLIGSTSSRAPSQSTPPTAIDQKSKETRPSPLSDSNSPLKDNTSQGSPSRLSNSIHEHPPPPPPILSFTPPSPRGGSTLSLAPLASIESRHSTSTLSTAHGSSGGDDGEGDVSIASADWEEPDEEKSPTVLAFDRKVQQLDSTASTSTSASLSSSP